MPRMAEFLRDKHTPEHCKQMMPYVYPLAVGGSKWWNCDQMLNGVNLPPHKREFGDQWNEYHASGYHPNYVVLSLGSNDSDRLFCSTETMDW